MFATWTGPGAAGDLDVFSTRIDEPRGVLDPPWFLLSSAGSAPLQNASAVAWSGSEWLVVWTDSRNPATGLDVYATRVSPTGTVLNPTGIPISTAVGGQTFPAVAWGGGTFMVVWTDRRSGVDDIYGTRVTGSGVVAEPGGIQITTDPNIQSSPSVTWDGGQYLVAWQDARPITTTDIYAARVAINGTVSDPNGFAVSTASGSQSVPVPAGNGSGAFVVWKDRRTGSDQIVGARVTTGGTTTDTNGVVLAGGIAAKGTPVVAFNGTNFLVVWDEAWAGSGQDVLAERVTPGAAILDSTPIPVSDEPGNQDFPAVAATTDFFVAWRDRRSLVDYDVYGARITAAGALQDPTGIAIATTGREERVPAVARAPGTGSSPTTTSWPRPTRSISAPRRRNDGKVHGG